MRAMDEDLVDYLLDGLDAKERREVEALLESDPGARARLEALRLALEPLAADRADPPPPRGLAARTLARVAACPCHELPRAPACGDAATGPTAPLWRRADVLVAACLLLTAGGLLLHWLAGLRRPDGSAQIIACQDNLRQLYFGLKTYSERHNN